MILRILITLALASSLSLIAAQEAQLDITKPRQQKIAKHFSKMVLAASLLTTSFGLYQGHPGLTGYGVGLLTGTACAIYDSKTDRYPMAVSWIVELLARLGVISASCAGLDQGARICVLRGSSFGSWSAYLGYRLAQAMDKEQEKELC